MQKLVRAGRGGYCFEQNLLFAHALHALGFEFGGLAARVIFGLPAGSLTARSHMLLRIELEGVTWIADVGFGVSTMTGPIALTAGIEQPTPHEPFRLTPAGADYVLETRVKDAWAPLYRFGLDAACIPDYEMASWYLCNCPGSHFTTGLVAARPAPDRRYALRNNVFAIHHRDGRTERRVLGTARELRDTLEGAFALRLPHAPELDAVLERVSSAPAVMPAGEPQAAQSQDAVARVVSGR